MARLLTELWAAVQPPASRSLSTGYSAISADMRGCRLKLVTVQTVPDRGILRACCYAPSGPGTHTGGAATCSCTPSPAGSPGSRSAVPPPHATAAAAARPDRRHHSGPSRSRPRHRHHRAVTAAPGPIPDRRLLLGFGRLPDHKIPAAVDALWSVLSQAGAASIPAAARHVADQPGDPPRLEVRQPAIRSDRADMWPGLPTATNTARPTESFSTNRKLTSRDSCPLSAVLVRPVRVAYIRILAAWRCCGSSDMTARPPVSWGTPDPRRGRAVLLAGRDAVRPRLTSLRRLCRPWLRACRRRAESRPAASCRRRPGC
jgi:hypothetical protein